MVSEFAAKLILNWDLLSSFWFGIAGKATATTQCVQQGGEHERQTRIGRFHIERASWRFVFDCHCIGGHLHRMETRSVFDGDSDVRAAAFLCHFHTDSRYHACHACIWQRIMENWIVSRSQALLSFALRFSHCLNWSQVNTCAANGAQGFMSNVGSTLAFGYERLQLVLNNVLQPKHWLRWPPKLIMFYSNFGFCCNSIPFWINALLN